MRFNKSIYLSIAHHSNTHIQRKENNNSYRFFELRSKRFNKTFIVFFLSLSLEMDVNVVERISASFDLNNLLIAFHTIIGRVCGGLSIAFKLKKKSIKAIFFSFCVHQISVESLLMVADLR